MIYRQISDFNLTQSGADQRFAKILGVKLVGFG